MKNLAVLIKVVVLVFLTILVVGMGVKLYRTYLGDTDVEIPSGGSGYEYEVEDITLNETEITF